MNLHEVLMEMSSRHKRIKGSGFSDLFYFDHKLKNIRNGNKFLVKEGKIIPQTIEMNDKKLILDDDWGLGDEEFYLGMEQRFDKYYSSVPSGYEQYVRTIFRTKPINKYTSFDEMMNAASNRQKARYELEWFFMANSVNGKIVWAEPNHYYWKSPNNKLILYKEETVWQG